MTAPVKTVLLQLFTDELHSTEQRFQGCQVNTEGWVIIRPMPSPEQHRESNIITTALTRELNGEALLAGEEVGIELKDDGVKGAVDVVGQAGAAYLL